MAEQTDLSRLFIIGPMGSGKSTVGRHLADLLGYVFVDSDVEIEMRAGADIPWIFDVEGEEGLMDNQPSELDSGGVFWINGVERLSIIHISETTRTLYI